jgi:hypothetical protein
MNGFKLQILLICLVFASLSFATPSSQSPIGSRTLYAISKYCKEAGCKQLGQFKFGVNTIYVYKHETFTFPDYAIIIRSKSNILQEVRFFSYNQEWDHVYARDFRTVITYFSDKSIRFEKNLNSITPIGSEETKVNINLKRLDALGNGLNKRLTLKIEYTKLKNYSIEEYFGSVGGVQNYQPCCGGANMSIIRIFDKSVTNSLPLPLQKELDIKFEDVLCKSKDMLC